MGPLCIQHFTSLFRLKQTETALKIVLLFLPPHNIPAQVLFNPKKRELYAWAGEQGGAVMNLKDIINMFFGGGGAARREVRTNILNKSTCEINTNPLFILYKIRTSVLALDHSISIDIYRYNFHILISIFTP